LDFGSFFVVVADDTENKDGGEQCHKEGVGREGFDAEKPEQHNHSDCAEIEVLKEDKVIKSFFGDSEVFF